MKFVDEATIEVLAILIFFPSLDEIFLTPFPSAIVIFLIPSIIFFNSLGVMLAL